jgi:aspartyl-tRNA(Asn)/glutamyl-tRNA(Gln) amidotransferase subunit A
MTSTVADAVLMMDVIAKPDTRAWTALPDDGVNYRQALAGGVKGLRIAYIPQFGSVQVDPEIAVAVERAAKVFEDLGAYVEQLDAPFEDPIDFFTVHWNAGAAQVVSGYGQEARAKKELLTCSLLLFQVCSVERSGTFTRGNRFIGNM